MKVKVTTVKELKEVLNKLPDCASVEHLDIEDSVIKGVTVNYDLGTSWSEPYVCFET